MYYAKDKDGAMQNYAIEANTEVISQRTGKVAYTTRQRKYVFGAIDPDSGCLCFTGEYGFRYYVMEGFRPAQGTR